MRASDTLEAPWWVTLGTKMPPLCHVRLTKIKTDVGLALNLDSASKFELYSCPLLAL